MDKIEKIDLDKVDWRSSREFFESLSEELEKLDDHDESYNFTWVGKRKSIIEAGVKHIYFVAEAKGVSEGKLDVDVKGVEKAKIECARKHFAKISNGDYIYGVCNSYQKLLELVKS